jgi:hypothetical protein
MYRKRGKGWIRTDHGCKDRGHRYDDTFLPGPEDETAVKLSGRDEMHEMKGLRAHEPAGLA